MDNEFSPSPEIGIIVRFSQNSRGAAECNQHEKESSEWIHF